ncbi:MAG: selenide, water dikinase SelD [bacterium]
MGPGDLSELMKGINYKEDHRLIVGHRDSDDAGVIRIGSEILLQTVDIITPIVDDAFTFGKIAATNALSDIYAMGGEPVSVLNIAAFPIDCLPITILREILLGGKEVIEESGAAVLGGHTIIDSEIKYGLAVTGVAGKKIFCNRMAEPSLDIILTKPLGGGILSTALKGEIITESHKNVMIKYMTRLNKYALHSITSYDDVATVTDVTGFGLLGHLFEVAKASKVTVKVYQDKVPFMEGFELYLSYGLIPAGAYRNREYVLPYTEGDTTNLIKFTSPETSGGLLIFCNKGKSEKTLDDIRKNGDSEAAIIGETVAFSGKELIIE